LSDAPLCATRRRGVADCDLTHLSTGLRAPLTCAQQINRVGGGANERSWEVWSDAFQVSPCWGTTSFGDPTPRSIHHQNLTHSKREDDRISLARRIAREQEGTI
jgi:hypothetical protein